MLCAHGSIAVLHRSQEASAATRVRPIAPNVPLARNVTEALLGFLDALSLVVADRCVPRVAVGFDASIPVP